MDIMLMLLDDTVISIMTLYCTVSLNDRHVEWMLNLRNLRRPVLENNNKGRNCTGPNSSGPQHYG
jgi:hypothetical protein